MKQTLSLTRKELSAYFGSPMALLFVGVFLAVSLFVFFWAEAFFARGIADVRPLFKWMPVLLIFLVGALTMRQWSEEQRSGTLEVLLTLPVGKSRLVLGKFLAVMALVALALALTLTLPISVALLGNLDWGPVIGGYLAAFLMAAAYTAIGLFISSRTDNQLVALILTVLVCGVLYLVGTEGLAGLVGRGVGTLFHALGSGSRFESIERGVVDLRDLVYYLSLAGIFLVLNTVSLDRKRWSAGEATTGYRRGIVLTSGLLVANLVAVNVWLYPLSGLRLDLTNQREYSLSKTTKTLLRGVAEPLTIRAYVSEKTHPLLAPLVPQVRDLLREYEIAGQGKVIAEVIDPATAPDMETEANQTYGIQPTPLQVSGRYEASVINTYFDILMRYGDQSEVLNFRDLIEIEPSRDGTINVRLRNLEYDLTRAVKKSVYGFQSVDSALAGLPAPATLTLFVTTDSVPPDLAGVPATIRKVAEDLVAKSSGKLTYEVVNPDAPDAKVTRQQVFDTYRLRPIAASLFSDQSYYLDMVLKVGDKWQILAPAGEPNEANVRASIESAVKRSSTGFLKVVGLWTPPEVPTQDMFGQQQAPFRTWRQLRQALGENYEVRDVDLASGQVPSDVSVLLVVSPQGLDDKARFAVDQYLMRGGSVVVAAGTYALTFDQMAGDLALEPLDGGLADLLSHYGISVDKQLVMDPQNEPFPVQTQRQVNGVAVREVQAINYPFFIDIRAAGMDKTSPVVSQLQAVTMNYASPVVVDAGKNAGRAVTTLLQSSQRSWLRAAATIQPDLQKYPETGFPVEGETAAHPLAVAIQGSFESYFKGKASPLAAPPAASADPNQPAPTPAAQSGGIIESSPDSSRLVVVGSADFLTDVIFQISSALEPNRYLNSLQFAQNAVDWSVEDLDLLGIRSRGTSSRVLAPLTEAQQRGWEIASYGLALTALVVIGALWNVRRKNERPMILAKPGKVGGVA